MGRGGQGGRGGRGGPSRNSAARHGGLNGIFVPFTSNGLSTGRRNKSHHSPAFSLKEEARATESHRSWNSDLKLRLAKVNFVHAGKLAFEELKGSVQEAVSVAERESFTRGIQPENYMANMSLEDRRPEERPLLQKESTSEDEPTLVLPRSWQEERYAEPEAKQDLFFADTKGSNTPADTGLSKPWLRRSFSLASSDSSGEVIIFPGRNHSRPNVGNIAGHVSSFIAKPPPSSESATFYDLAKPRVFSGGLRVTVLDDPPSPNVDDATPAMPGVPLNIESTTKSQEKELVGFDHVPTSGPTRQNKWRKHSAKQVEEDKVLADYIENIEEGERVEELMTSSGLLKRDIGGTDSGGWQGESSDEERMLQPNVVAGGGTGWDSADLRDLDDLSTSDEVQTTVEAVLSKRRRPSGNQYLVVWEGYTADDARWIPQISLNTPNAQEQVRVYETQVLETEELTINSDDSDCSATMDEKVAMGMQDELDDMKDEQDLLDRERARMTDEQMARLLSKQEELGLGSDELVIFDGDEEEGTKEWDDEAAPQPLSFWNQPMVRRKRTTRLRQEIPFASAFADVLGQNPYNGFDVMDHGRPSLQKKPKSRRGQLASELSDSELENSLLTAWQNDRFKKKMRKQEREELRVQGLLGKKGKVDMKAKYKEGISWEDVKKEIGTFLISTKETLPLPPLNTHDRKRVHEIANIFNLKSKSVGGGTSRFPTLYKTSRTTVYDGDALSSIEAKLNSRQFLHRSDKRGAQNLVKRSTAARKGRGSGFASAGISYRDGEVVGAAAPEIGSENRGRTMLEKMGWSTGTALGALNNKGIMQPVTHVVKTTKAGLG